METEHAGQTPTESAPPSTSTEGAAPPSAPPSEPSPGVSTGKPEGSDAPRTRGSGGSSVDSGESGRPATGRPEGSDVPRTRTGTNEGDTPPLPRPVPKPGAHLPRSGPAIRTTARPTSAAIPDDVWASAIEARGQEGEIAPSPEEKPNDGRPPDVPEHVWKAAQRNAHRTDLGGGGRLPKSRQGRTVSPSDRPPRGK